MSKWIKLQEDPFGFIDGLSWKVKGYELNFLKDEIGIRKEAFAFAIVCLAAWIVFGFDSTPLQFIHVLYDGVPGLIMGQKTWADLVQIYHSFYGKEMHYSAFVIYMLLYWALSKTWSRVGVKGFKNVAYSFIGMFLAIAVFEWFWILGFATFQNQPWVATWKWPQLKILLQNLAFTVTGALGCLYIWVDSYILEAREIIGRNWHFPKFLRAWKLWILVVLSVAAALFWIYYPWPVQQISVTLENGQVWESSRLFPQTLYTVDLNPADGVNAGVWFYVQNDLVHAVNTIVKVLWAATAYMFFQVKRPNEN